MSESNLQIQCNPYQNTNGILIARTNNPKMAMESRKTSNSQNHSFFNYIFLLKGEKEIGTSIG